MSKAPIQPRKGNRFKLRQTLFILDAGGIILGLFCYHISLGSFVAGVLALTELRTRQVIEESRRRGSPLTRRCRVRLPCESLLVAMTIMTGSLAVTLATYIQLGGPPAKHFLDPVAVFLGILAGYIACVILRRRLWPYRYPDPPGPPPSENHDHWKDEYRVEPN